MEFLEKLTMSSRRCWNKREKREKKQAKKKERRQNRSRYKLFFFKLTRYLHVLGELQTARKVNGDFCVEQVPLSEEGV
jgi:hypothetical protein